LITAPAPQLGLEKRDDIKSIDGDLINSRLKSAAPAPYRHLAKKLHGQLDAATDPARALERLAILSKQSRLPPPPNEVD
jgi:hypothetical protein